MTMPKAVAAISVLVLVVAWFLPLSGIRNADGERLATATTTLETTEARIVEYQAAADPAEIEMMNRLAEFRERMDAELADWSPDDGPIPDLSVFSAPEHSDRQRLIRVAAIVQEIDPAVAVSQMHATPAREVEAVPGLLGSQAKLRVQLPDLERALAFVLALDDRLEMVMTEASIDPDAETGTAVLTTTLDWYLWSE